MNDEEEGEEYPTIPRMISRHERDTPGIWRGDMSRTPVAKLEGNFNGHFSGWFGDAVVFQMKRTGGRVRGQWAPRLAHVMRWYEDTNGEWVCYRSEKEESRRYGPVRRIRLPVKPVSTHDCMA